jgi:cysteine desulfuration protein SufE
MSETNEKIPARLQEIVEDFAFCEGREKLELLLEYSEHMPPLPDWLQEKHDGMDQVQECMTPVYVQAKTEDGKMTFFFDVPAESPTVRGYAAIMAEGLQGATPEEVLSVPVGFYLEMGLEKVLTQQRLNGISAILAHMKRLALKTMQS